MGSIITLVTDFGLHDLYVGIMKGVMLSINPEAVIVDICHTIEPQNIQQAAFVLGSAHRYFPEGAVHVAVVDPGVGSKRRAVILKTLSAYFVAPDNGVLSYVLAEAGASSDAEPGQGELGPGLKAVAITEPRFWRHPVSSTFHGRDIFAPVAAHLSLGLSICEFGEVIHSLIAFSPSQPQLTADGIIVGHVVYVDCFGNLVTDINGNLVDRGALIEVSGRYILGLSSCYAEGAGLLALIGSSGTLEIAAKNKSAAALLNAGIGDEVRIKR